MKKSFLFLVPLCQTECKKRHLLSTSFCTHPSDKQIQRMAFCSTTQQPCQCSPPPHLVLAPGQEPCSRQRQLPSLHSSNCLNTPPGASHGSATQVHSPSRVSEELVQQLQPGWQGCPISKQAPTSACDPHLLSQGQTDQALQMVITFIDVRWYTNRSVSISLSTSPRLGEKLEEWGRQGNRTGLSLQDAELSGGEEGQGLQRQRVLLP